MLYKAYLETHIFNGMLGILACRFYVLNTKKKYTYTKKSFRICAP